MISHLRKSEESEREGTSFHEIISETVIHIPASFCASLRSENDCHFRLWLGCEFTMLYNAQILVYLHCKGSTVQAWQVIQNIVSHLFTPKKRVQTSASKKFSEQKPNYNCCKFSEPFTKLQLGWVKGSKYFQVLYLAFCLTLGIQILTNFD